MSVKLSPVFQEAQDDGNGNPWVNAQLFTYTGGSSVKQTTYQDQVGTPHTNPIVLNSRGEPPAPIWLTTGVNYKFVLTSPTDTDPPVSPTRTIDGVTGVGDTATITQDEWVSGPAPTYVSATQFSLAGDQRTAFHVGRRVKTTNTGGTVYSTITVSAFGALTTITVVNDSSTLDSGLSAVSYGLISSSNTSSPGSLGSLSVGNFSASVASISAGAVILTMGTGSGRATAGGVANVQISTVGNVGGGQDTLLTYTLPANSLSADGKAVRVLAFGGTANNGNTKQLFITFGGTTLLGTNLTTSLGAQWNAQAVIVRTGASAQTTWCRLEEGSQASGLAGANTKIFPTQSTAAKDTTAAQVIQIEAVGVSNNDVTQAGMIVEFMN